MKKFVIILMIIQLAGLLLAESGGEYGFKMLTIDIGTSISAQGGTGSFSNYDSFSFLANPAAGVYNRGEMISVAHKFWIFDTSLTGLGYIKSTGKRSFGVAFRQLDYGKIDERDDTGDLIGEFHPLDLVFTLHGGYRINPDHYAAINISGLYEKIDDSSSLGGSLDLGYAYITPIKELMVAAAVKHLGFTTKMDKEKLPLPLSFEFSLIKGFETEVYRIFAELKTLKNIDDENIKGAVGINAILYDRFSLRLGYKINYDAEDFSVGVGFQIRRFYIDYTYLPFDYEIDDVHMIGLSYRF